MKSPTGWPNKGKIETKQSSVRLQQQQRRYSYSTAQEQLFEAQKERNRIFKLFLFKSSSEILVFFLFFLDYDSQIWNLIF